MSGAIERCTTAKGEARYSVRDRKPDRQQARRSGFGTKRDAQAHLPARTPHGMWTPDVEPALHGFGQRLEGGSEDERALQDGVLQQCLTSGDRVGP